MALQLYNSVARKQETFQPVQAGKVTLYTCGPTVYNYIHIGNLRTFLFEDLLRRWLVYSGYEVKHVKNMTDVDDKTIAGAQVEKMLLSEFTQKYGLLFLEDMRTVGALSAHQYPLATKHIPQILKMIQILIQKGLAYSTSKGNVYYRTALGKSFQQLLAENVELEVGASGRVDSETDKEQPQDFALWKAWTPKDGDARVGASWKSPYGEGRPGWHIECSAMSLHAFKDALPIDIHTGGIDLMFPHHQCEILQSEGVLGDKFVNYWMHAAHLLVDGQKMSKSLGNFYTLRDVLERGHDPKVVRYLLLSAHYRHPLNFTWESLSAAGHALRRWHEFVNHLRRASESGSSGLTESAEITGYMEAWKLALDRDLDVCGALGELFLLMNHCYKLMAPNTMSSELAAKVLAFLHKADTVYNMLIPDEFHIAPETLQLIEERARERGKRNWVKADEMRIQLRQLGIVVEDTKTGQRWKRA